MHPVVALVFVAAQTGGVPVATDHAVVSGYVEITRDDELGAGVLLSTPTDGSSSP
jgi:hypothetical protein